MFRVHNEKVWMIKVQNSEWLILDTGICSQRPQVSLPIWSWSYVLIASPTHHWWCSGRTGRTNAVCDSSLGSFVQSTQWQFNDKNILSGTGRLREKRQSEQDCNRKNSHKGLKTQCVLETPIITRITIIIISHKSSCALTGQPRMALSNPEWGWLHPWIPPILNPNVHEFA